MGVKTNLFIRRAERDDLDTVVHWMEDPDFRRFLYGDPARSPRQIREHIVAMLGRTAGHTVPGAIYLVIDSPDYGPIGLLSLQNISWRNRACSIDLYIGRKELRVGIAAAVAYWQTLAYCFEELNLHRVSAFVYSFNTASWRMLELSGAVREMTLREHVVRDGERHDMYCYGMLRSEYVALRDGRATRFKDVSLNAMMEARLKAQEAAETTQ